jgi:hypothetical protein
MIETPLYIINASNSHEDMWIFTVKKDNTSFAINADEHYIRSTYDKNY